MRGLKAYLKLTVIALSFCLMLLGCLAATDSGKKAASFVITPSSGAPSNAIEFIGSGFKPGEVIEIIMVVDDVPTDLGSKPMVKKADESGAFKFKGNIPRNAAPGLNKVEAIGDKGTIAEATLEVVKKKK